MLGDFFEIHTYSFTKNEHFEFVKVFSQAEAKDKGLDEVKSLIV